MYFATTVLSRVLIIGRYVTTRINGTFGPVIVYRRSSLVKFLPHFFRVREKRIHEQWMDVLFKSEYKKSE